MLLGVVVLPNALQSLHSLLPEIFAVLLRQQQETATLLPTAPFPKYLHVVSHYTECFGGIAQTD
jgi:hypothetical protein